jgi:excisionase family DNA binding protein
MSDLVVTLTTAQLEALIERAVRKVVGQAPVEFLKTDAIARRLGMHPKTVTRLVRVEGLPAHRPGGGEYRFRVSEVDAWLEARGARKAG